ARSQRSSTEPGRAPTTRSTGAPSCGRKRSAPARAPESVASLFSVRAKPASEEAAPPSVARRSGKSRPIFTRASERRARVEADHALAPGGAHEQPRLAPRRADELQREREPRRVEPGGE